jgi:hypothetical protein
MGFDRCCTRNETLNLKYRKGVPNLQCTENKINSRLSDIIQKKLYMNNCYCMKILCTILVTTHLISQLNLKISVATATHIMHKS